MFYKIYSHMSLMKAAINCFFGLKMQSANVELKLINSKAFKNPEHFSISEIDGVIVECLIQKNSPKKVEYFKKILCSFTSNLLLLL